MDTGWLNATQNLVSDGLLAGWRRADLTFRLGVDAMRRFETAELPERTFSLTPLSSLWGCRVIPDLRIPRNAIALVDPGSTWIGVVFLMPPPGPSSPIMRTPNPLPPPQDVREQ